MQYTSFTVTEDKKNNRHRVWATHKDGSWEGGSTFMELYPVSGVLVAMQNITKPVAVFKDLEHACETLEKQYGVKPVVK